MLQSRALVLLGAVWLQSAHALSRSALQPISAAKNNSLRTYWTDPHKEGFLLVVPQLKLLMCALPKNACTQFKLVANAVTGLGDSTLDQWSTKHDLKKLLADRSWTKAVFLRDPLERLISGYRSKCEPPMEGDGYNCMNFEESTPKSWPSFDRFASELHRCHNPHFDPQVSFCSLGSNLDDFNFVGKISTDYQAVHSEVQQLFKQALTRRGNMSQAKLDILSKAIAKNFPPQGFTAGHMDHYHPDTDVREYYQNKATLQAAMQHYIVDYDSLPLKIPAWVPKDVVNRARSDALAALPARKDEDPRLSCRVPS